MDGLKEGVTKNSRFIKWSLKNPLWLTTNLNIGSNMSLFMSVVGPWMDVLLAVKVSEMWRKPEVLKESTGKCKSVPLSYCQAESWPCLEGPKELLIFNVKPITEMNECADARIRKCIIDPKVICCCEQQLLCLTDRWRSHSTQPLLSSFMFHVWRPDCWALHYRPHVTAAGTAQVTDGRKTAGKWLKRWHIII